MRCSRVSRAKVEARSLVRSSKRWKRSNNRGYLRTADSVEAVLATEYLLGHPREDHRQVFMQQHRRALVEIGAFAIDDHQAGAAVKRQQRHAGGGADVPPLPMKDPPGGVARKTANKGPPPQVSV